jgi:cation diffusion facilitator CzcD-associated flavoprotein CzcO
MCKRQVLASRYYRAIQSPGVELVTDSIDHVEGAGVVTTLADAWSDGPSR